jgi:MoxR-like ATPase
VSIPELGTIRAPAPPIAILTSNRTREIHDAIKRRCLYHWIGYPTAERELAILAARAPEVPPALAAQIVAFVQRLRAKDLFKLPGIAETLDWGHALVALSAVELDPAMVDATLGVLLKYQDDLARITGPAAHELVAAARAAR